MMTDTEINDFILKEKKRLYAKRWRDKNREKYHLNARNYVYNHKEEHQQKVYEWRRRKPELVKLQNKRAKKNLREKTLRNQYLNGIYAKIKWKIQCPRCKQELRTSAKRPGCSCGYVFPRRYMERFIDTLPTTPCHCCDREIPYQENARLKRKYCENCFPQIQALRKFIKNHKYKVDQNELYRKNKEIVVAVTCIFCDDIIPGHRNKKICKDCYLKWERKIPKKVHEALNSSSSFNELPHELRIWKIIKNYRERDITYSLRKN